MKLRILLLALLLILGMTFIGCSNSSTGSCSESGTNPFLGSWRFNETWDGGSFTITATFNANMTFTGQFDEICCCIQFQESVSGTYTFSGNIATVSWIWTEDEEYTITATITGNRLYVYLYWFQDGERLTLNRI
jgi:hypothetical protein